MQNERFRSAGKAFFRFDLKMRKKQISFSQYIGPKKILAFLTFWNQYYIVPASNLGHTHILSVEAAGGEQTADAARRYLADEMDDRGSFVFIE